jgi:hypothetical protein
MLPATAQNQIARFCNQCGNALQPNARFCNKCGSAISISLSQAIKPVAPALISNQAGQGEIVNLERLMTENPDDESYAKLLAVQLHDDAMKDWWKDPSDGQYLCTSLRQIQYARKQLDRAEALNFTDSGLRADLAKTSHLVNSMEDRQYTGTWLQVIILGFFGVIPGLIWWFVNRRPVFLMNRDYVKHLETGKHPNVGAKMGGAMEKVSDFFDSVTGGWGGIFALAFMVIFSPIFMILAFKQNYLDSQEK